MRSRAVGSSVLVLMFSSSVTLAGIITVGPFAGDHSEGWETGLFDPVFAPQVEDILGGTADARSVGGSLHATRTWVFASTIGPHSGSWLAGSASGTAWEIEFHRPISLFGGYFGTNAVASNMNAPDGSASFFDQADLLLGTSAIVLGNGGTWTWNGWRSDAGPIKKVQLSSGSIGGSFLMVDDLQATVPEPGTTLLMGLALTGLALGRRLRQNG